jgi:hypothetical protein
MVFNATFNNISAISWQLVLLVEETGVPGENHWQTLSHNVVSSTPHHEQGSNSQHCIGGIMVSMLASSAVERGFEPRSGQTKDYKICICCFSAKHAALRRKSKDWSAQNQNNVSEWSDMSTHGLLFQWASTIKIQLSMLV